MTSLTRADVAALGRRRQQPTRAPGELLAVFVPGKLVNPLNASAWMWQKRSRLARQWKERTAMALLEAGWRQYENVGRFGGVIANGRALAIDRYCNFQDSIPKRVTFIAHTWNEMDTDGLQAALKPVRDALVECGVLHSDAPGSGHAFAYTQQIDRAHRGVEIRVALAPRPEAR